MNFEDINWSDPNSPISVNFTVREALWLPSWGVYHTPSDAEKQNIFDMANKMEQVRSALGDHPINVNCWIRPTCVQCDSAKFQGRNYNAAVGGAPLSAHIAGKAVDFTVSTVTCDDARYMLTSDLETINLRMEKKPGSGWIHLGNDWAPGKTRYFIP